MKVISHYSNLSKLKKNKRKHIKNNNGSKIFACFDKHYKQLSGDAKTIKFNTQL